jgi:hypothetical protein
MILGFALAIAAGAATADQEHLVKAAFIANFIKFIEWPDLGRDNVKFVVGIYGADDFDTAIDQALAGKSVSGHPIVIQQIHSESEMKACRLVVCNTESAERIAKLTKACASGTVLVGEGEDFAKDGGDIGLVVVASRVRFDINLDTARKAGVTISSKLLSLARTVYK